MKAKNLLLAGTVVPMFSVIALSAADAQSLPLSQPSIVMAQAQSASDKDKDKNKKTPPGQQRQAPAARPQPAPPPAARPAPPPAARPAPPPAARPQPPAARPAPPPAARPAPPPTARPAPPPAARPHPPAAAPRPTPPSRPAPVAPNRPAVAPPSRVAPTPPAANTPQGRPPAGREQRPDRRPQPPATQNTPQQAPAARPQPAAPTPVPGAAGRPGAAPQTAPNTAPATPNAAPNAGPARGPDAGQRGERRGPGANGPGTAAPGTVPPAATAPGANAPAAGQPGMPGPNAPAGNRLGAPAVIPVPVPVPGPNAPAAGAVQQPPAAQGAQAAPTAQGALAPVASPEALRGRGQSLQDFRGQRRETQQGGRTIIQEPGRTIIRDGNRTVIQHNETERFRLNARDVRSERRNGENFTTVVRPDGARIVTITDDNGRLIRRLRRDRNGRDVVIIDNSRRSGPGVGAAVGIGVGLGLAAVLNMAPPHVTIPRESYIVDTDGADSDLIYDTLIAPPVERLDRNYTLDEIRYSAPLRDRMRRVDVDTINFDTGSWEVSPAQADRLAFVAQAINRAIERNPNEVFLIEGHTDAVGNDIDNLSLSDRRAEAVALVLTEQFNVPPENLTTQGYGEQYLKVNTDGPERQNRRVTVRRITPLLNGQTAAAPR